MLGSSIVQMHEEAEDECSRLGRCVQEMLSDLHLDSHLNASTTIQYSEGRSLYLDLSATEWPAANRTSDPFASPQSPASRRKSSVTAVNTRQRRPPKLWLEMKSLKSVNGGQRKMWPTTNATQCRKPHTVNSPRSGAVTERSTFTRDTWRHSHSNLSPRSHKWGKYGPPISCRSSYMVEGEGPFSLQSHSSSPDHSPCATFSTSPSRDTSSDPSESSPDGAQIPQKVEEAVISDYAVNSSLVTDSTDCQRPTIETAMVESLALTSPPKVDHPGSGGRPPFVPLVELRSVLNCEPFTELHQKLSSTDRPLSSQSSRLRDQSISAVPQLSPLCEADQPDGSSDDSVSDFPTSKSSSTVFWQDPTSNCKNSTNTQYCVSRRNNGYYRYIDPSPHDDRHRLSATVDAFRRLKKSVVGQMRMNVELMANRIQPKVRTLSDENRRLMERHDALESQLNCADIDIAEQAAEVAALNIELDKLRARLRSTEEENRRFTENNQIFGSDMLSERLMTNPIVLSLEDNRRLLKKRLEVAGTKLELLPHKAKGVAQFTMSTHCAAEIIPNVEIHFIGSDDEEDRNVAPVHSEYSEMDQSVCGETIILISDDEVNATSKNRLSESRQTFNFAAHSYPSPNWSTECFAVSSLQEGTTSPRNHAFAILESPKHIPHPANKYSRRTINAPLPVEASAHTSRSSLHGIPVGPRSHRKSLQEELSGIQNIPNVEFCTTEKVPSDKEAQSARICTATTQDSSCSKSGKCEMLCETQTSTTSNNSSTHHSTPAADERQLEANCSSPPLRQLRCKDSPPSGDGCEVPAMSAGSAKDSNDLTLQSRSLVGLLPHQPRCRPTNGHDETQPPTWHKGQCTEGCSRPPHVSRHGSEKKNRRRKSKNTRKHTHSNTHPSSSRQVSPSISTSSTGRKSFYLPWDTKECLWVTSLLQLRSRILELICEDTSLSQVRRVLTAAARLIGATSRIFVADVTLLLRCLSCHLCDRCLYTPLHAVGVL